MYTLEDFILDVKYEAEKLKAAATKEELAKLDFINLSPTKARSCVYGQITGDCFSKRAAELIVACCPRYFDRVAMDRACVLRINLDMVDIAKAVNGTHVDDFFRNRTKEFRPLHYSAIEIYLISEGAKKLNLINYLKGHTDTLDI